MATGMIHPHAKGAENATQDVKSPVATTSPKPPAGRQLFIAMVPGLWFDQSGDNAGNESSGRRFRQRRFARLLDDRVRGQVSVRFANKIPTDQLHDVLESVLEVKGFAVIPAGPITKIVPLGTAKQRGVAVTGSGPPKPGNGR
jgi:hypothetical protein